MRYAMSASSWQRCRQLWWKDSCSDCWAALWPCCSRRQAVSAFLAHRIAGSTATETPALSPHPDFLILLFNFGLAFLW